MHTSLRNLLLKTLFSYTLLLLLTASAATPSRPNIIFVLVDDMGWTDLGCYGSDYYETPNIDKLAQQGVRFTDAYAACTVCSPSRASIMTGQYPARLHITDWISGHKFPDAKLRVPRWTKKLSPTIPNLAQTLKAQGYATASIGKWHLGPDFPDKQGFDINIGGCEVGRPTTYFSPYNIQNLPNGPEGEFLTDREVAETIKFIKANRERPFFVYLAHYAVHTPLGAKEEVIQKYRDKRKQKRSPRHNTPRYAALIESIDDGIGAIRSTLDTLDLNDNTVIIFTSDNGGLLKVTSNAPLRDGKGSVYEGGVRVPLIIHWPGVAQSGTICQTPVCGIDFFPTLLDFFKLDHDSSSPIDGVSLLPLVSGKGELNRNTLYWHYPHYHTEGATPYGAIRDGYYRLIEFYEDSRIELYNLETDPGEKINLAATMPDKAAELKQKLANWRTATKAQMPAPNPNQR